MRSSSNRSVRLFVACCALAACTQEPDLKTASCGDLIKLAATAKRGDAPTSLANRAQQELFGRPQTTVVENLLTALDNDSAAIRSCAAKSFSHFMEPLTGSTREVVDVALSARLGDADEDVRASALISLGQGCVERRPDRVPEEVLGAIRSLVVSSNDWSRFSAANAAMWFGPGAASLTPLLVAQAKVEVDSGVRFMLATAMSQTGPQDPAVAICLQALLDDDEQKVRFAAAGGLGETVTPPASVIERLRRSVADPAEAADVRKSAASSLASLATSSAAAESNLSAVLGIQTLFKDYERSSWLVAVGKLAALAPTGESATKARRLLESATQTEDRDEAAVANSSLARIAFATRDADLGRQAATELRQLVPKVLSAAEQEQQWDRDSAWTIPAVEALVLLAGWPEMQIDTDELAPAFAALKLHRFHWTRDWADAQLALLR